ncbi:MAG: hypothetical protein AABX70_05510 [Nanoarchaeota archaeon]
MATAVVTINDSLKIELGPEAYYARFPGEGHPVEVVVSEETTPPDLLRLVKAIDYARANPGTVYNRSKLYLLTGAGELRPIKGGLELVLDTAQGVGGEEVGTIHIQTRPGEETEYMEGDVTVLVGTPKIEDIAGYPVHRGYALLIKEGTYAAYLDPEIAPWIDTIPDTKGN